MGRNDYNMNGVVIKIKDQTSLTFPIFFFDLLLS